MAYSPTTTFVAAQIMQATLIQDELDAIQAYLNGSVVSGDLSTTPWVEAKHLVKGHYHPVINRMDFISGPCGGKNYLPSGSNLSWLGDGPTQRNAAADSAYVNVPNTTVEFYLEDTADALFQFYGSPVSVYPFPTGAAGDLGNLYISIDGVRKVITRTSTRYEADVSLDRHYLTTFYVIEDLAAGYHSISLVGNINQPYLFLVSWGVSYETWYQ
jgi:hypothetical protein